MSRRFFYICAITREKIDIRKADTVKIAGKGMDGKSFECYAKMDDFFERFVNHPDVPNPLPGLRPYRSRKLTRIRFVFSPARFGEYLDSWKAGGVFCQLLMGDNAPQNPEEILRVTC